MVEFLRRLLNEDTLSPHGICLLWRPELVWIHVVSDAIIGIAYLSIPVALAYFISNRKDQSFGWIFWCFVTFILACGITHVLSIVTLWRPIYGIEGLIKVVTALASITTAIALWPMIPRLLALPSPERLRIANEALTARVLERDHALSALEIATAERLKAEDMLRQSQKMEAIGQLTGGIAHDFNNLLNVVIANLERIKRRFPDNPELRRRVGDALAGADRAASLTHQLLAFARKQPLLPRIVHVEALLARLNGLLQGAMEGRLGIRISVAPDLPAVRIDPNQLENALLNLVVNARDARGNEGFGQVEITVTPVRAEDAAAIEGLRAATAYVSISVRDDGPGMSSDVLERAFEPFFTTKAFGQGTGLGLSQVYGFVRQSGGHAVVRSEAGRGTEVNLYLPVCQGDPDTDAAIDTSDPTSISALAFASSPAVKATGTAFAVVSERPAGFGREACEIVHPPMARSHDRFA